MTQSLFTSITGMTTSQTKLDVIANNIANMNTTAFKSSNLTFSDLYLKTLSAGSSPTSTTGGTNPMQVGLGVGLSGISTDFTAGSVQATGNTNDLNIQGQGWFTVLSGNSIALTRDGSFSLDSSGYLVTQGGLKVLGTATTFASVGSKTPVQVPINLDIIKKGKNMTSVIDGKIDNLNNAKITRGTLTFSVTGRIPEEPNPEIEFLEDITIDSSDCASLLAIAKKMNDEITAKNENGTYKHPGLISKEGKALVVAEPQEDGTFTFSVKTDKGTDPKTGEEVDVDVVKKIIFGKSGDTSNFFSETGLANKTMDEIKNPDGTISKKYISNVLSYEVLINKATSSASTVAKTNYSVSDSGALAVTYSNGDTIAVEEGENKSIVLKYMTAEGKTITSNDIIVSGNAISPANLQIQLASVVNDQGLKAQQGNIFVTGQNTGDLTFSVGNANGFGEIASSGLELSNVNLAIELANMIVAQRAIDANSRVFSTTSEVLQRLVNLQ